MRTPMLITALAAALLLAGCPDETPTADVDPDQDAERLEARLAALEAENERLAEENLELAEENAELAAELERVQAELADAEGREPEDEVETEQPAMGTAEALTHQPRAEFPDPEDHPMGWEPGTTEWRETEVPDGFGPGEAAYDRPGELVVAVAGARYGDWLDLDAWEVTARVLLPEGELPETAHTATGAVLAYGFKDDAVAGTDLRLELARDADGWHVTAAEQRDHCMRGVGADGTTCT